jgi:hypothetical protein
MNKDKDIRRMQYWTAELQSAASHIDDYLQSVDLDNLLQAAFAVSRVEALARRIGQALGYKIDEIDPRS